MALSGGMKRRVMIAKALVHEPRILFLDEPSAGVDVELRRDMWQMVRDLRDSGVTIILTTHYIEEAEEMADRIGIINKGELMLVEDKAHADAQARAARNCACTWPNHWSRFPAPLAALPLTLSADRHDAGVTASAPRASATRITALLRELNQLRPELPRPARPSRARWRTSSCRWCRSAP